MNERKLKFHVPKARRTAIHNALRSFNASDQEQHAYYYDTPDHELGQKGISLCVRCEAGQWLQTISFVGPDKQGGQATSHPRKDGTLSLAVYKGTEVADILQPYRKTLHVRFETRITRLAAVQVTEAAEIEIAYDRGTIISGHFGIPVAEMEFRLLSGDLNELFTLCESWVNEYGLVLDLQSKAALGDRLARAASGTPIELADNTAKVDSKDARPPSPSMVGELLAPRRSEPLHLEAKLPIAEAYQAIALACLTQVIQNLAYLALAHDTHARPHDTADYVHQARVGIRRLRSCWKLFEGWLGDSPPKQLEEVRRLFSRLGELRDSHIMADTIEPALLAAGMPPLEQSLQQKDSHEKAIELARETDTQFLLLQLLRDVANAADTNFGSDSSRSFDKRFQQRVDRWLKKITEAGLSFKELSIDEQHAVRKKAKRLRYGLEFGEDLLPAKRLKKVRRTLARAQDVLGELNDLYVAEGHYRRLTDEQPSAWFAIGWLKSQQAQQLGRAQDAFIALADVGSLRN